jgi:aquaporin Z
MATKKAATTKKASSTRKTVSTKTSSKPRTTVTTTTVAAAVTAPSFSESIRQFSFWRALAAEFIGTFLLASVFIVGQGQPLYVFFAFVGIVLLLGTVSGSYANPAVAIAAWVSRRISWIRALGYVIFEILGALVAYVVLSGFIGGAASSATTGAGATLFAAAPLASGKEWYVFFAELLGTAIVGFAFANALRNTQDRLTSAFTAGAGLFVALMIAFIGASYVGGTAILNPAVAASLKALSWNVWPLAVYILAPVVGAIVGFFLNDFVKGRASK